jgi:hypothetical protein
MKKNTRSLMSFKGILFLILMLSVSSCLKNGQYDIDFSQVGSSVDIPLAAYSGNGIAAFSFGSTDSTFPVIVNMASPSPSTTPTTITLSLDTAYLNSYNADNGTAYSVLPDSVYSTTGWSLTIPAGKRLDTMMVTFFLSKLDASQSYVLPITISSASLPIEQWNHLLLSITVVSQYAITYAGTGTRYNYTGAVSYTYPGVIPPATTTSDLTFTKTASTDAPNIIEIPYANLGASGDNYVITMNPDQTIASVDPNPLFAGTITGWKVYFAGYDPSTKTYHLVTGYTNGSGNDRIVDETFVGQ